MFHQVPFTNIPPCYSWRLNTWKQVPNKLYAWTWFHICTLNLIWHKDLDEINARHCGWRCGDNPKKCFDKPNQETFFRKKISTLFYNHIFLLSSPLLKFKINCCFLFFLLQVIIVTHLKEIGKNEGYTWEYWVSPLIIPEIFELGFKTTK
jgi:hypothetical protein